MVAPALALTALAVALAGCTPMQWQHASYGNAPSNDELGYCDQSAYYEAQRQAFFSDFMQPRYVVGRDGRIYPRAPFARYPYRDRFYMERQLFDYCMRAKGYQLVPARPADRSG
jgi:hypothetical protein